MNLSQQDLIVLRDLGRQVAEIAALPDQQRTIAFWKKLNGLKPARPMVAIDQIPWHEMNVNDELTLRCTDAEAKKVETDLRRRLYRWRHMRADYVMEATLGIAPVLTGTDIGPKVEEDRAVGDPQNSVVGHLYHDQIQTEADLAKITMPQVQYDAAATGADIAAWREVFDGILTVEMQGMGPMLNVWDAIVMWRSVEGILMDLADRPEFLHQLMRRVTDAYSSRLDQYEALGVMAKHQSWIHCTGAWTDELPAPGFNPAKPRLKDNWVSGMAQIFGSVSPAMHQEFDLDYLNPLYARFGLVYYGCCEPLHAKLDIVRKIPNVRKVSMSPWVDEDAGAAGLGTKYVFSRKPTPALLAGDRWDPQAVEDHLRKTITACRRTGTPLELIIKDISTVRYEPQRLWQWNDIAMRLVQE
jgi:hypothetical protein